MDELGAFVRTRRERLRPEAVGLPARASRRTSGLRREDVAALAGVSVDYLVRLEQGRATNPSAQVVAALARALALTADERDHLFRLAHQAVPTSGLLPTALTPGIDRMITRLTDAAVSVHDPAWTILAWNPTWAALMGDPSAFTGRDRNLVWRHFTGGSGRVERGDSTDFEREAVADLRAATGRYPDDPQLKRLITDLLRESERFAARWAEHDIAVRRADRKTIRHPDVGPITVDCDVLRTDGSGLTIIVYTAAPGSPDAALLDLVRVIGLQRLAS